MGVNELCKAGVNYSEGIERFAKNEELYRKYLNKFCDDKMFDNLFEAIKEKNYKLAFDCAHSLKSTTGSLGMNRLYTNVCDITEELREKADFEVNVTKVNELNHICKKNYIEAISAIRIFFNE